MVNNNLKFRIQSAINNSRPTFGVCPKIQNSKLISFFILLSVFCLLTSVYASVPISLKSSEDNKICVVCHRKQNLNKTLPSGKIVSLFVDENIFNLSVHKERMCTECHSEIKEIPHKAEIKIVSCTNCHYIGSKYAVPQIKGYQQYQESVHKKALLKGNPDAPTCQDCHGVHNIFSPKNPKSKIYHKNIPETCGRCHLKIYNEYQESVHGEALTEGNKDVPVCTTCHGEHNILAPKDKYSKVFTTTIPETCGKCHKSEKIMNKYGIEVDKYETYKDSYHGVANQFGVKTVANCSSCHTAHNVRKASDPKSSINKKNIPKTCGKCHKNLNVNVANGRIHIDPENKREGAVYYLTLFFKILTFSTLAALIAHIFLDLFRKIKEKMEHEKENNN